MRAVLFLAFFALLLASLGPVLDHHFAERQQAHTHFYFGVQVPDHQHPYQQAHLHPHQPDTAGQSPPSHSDWTGDMVYLTDYDGIGLGFATITGPLLYASVVFPGGGDGPILRAEAAPDAWSETAVAPLERPPLV